MDHTTPHHKRDLMPSYLRVATIDLDALCFYVGSTTSLNGSWSDQTYREHADSAYRYDSMK